MVRHKRIRVKGHHVPAHRVKGHHVKGHTRVVRQTGKSVKRYDLRYGAKRVGKRRSASGRIYYEYRRNRSDKNRKKRL